MIVQLSDKQYDRFMGYFSGLLFVCSRRAY